MNYVLSRKKCKAKFVSWGEILGISDARFRLPMIRSASCQFG